MKKYAIAAVAAIPTLSLIGYWVFWQTMDAIGRAIDNMGDIETWGEDWED